MRLLDLFCGAGGCSVGYHRAGFEVVGVDLHPQKHYPFEFHQGDALEYLLKHGHEYDVIHASPPCQKYSSLRNMPNTRDDHPDLVEPARKLLQEIGKPYVIENVPGAPLARGSIMLCGTMFGLGVKAARAELRRHRWFECSFAMLLGLECRHLMATIGNYGDGNGRDYRRNPVQVIGVYGDHSASHGNEKMKRLVKAGAIPARPIQVVGVYGNQGHHNNQAPRRPSVVGVWGNAGGASIRDGVQQFTTKERAEAMGIDWMTGKELSQAIPPAYTEFIGRAVMRHVQEAK